jgi:hypothetical protein
MMTAWRQGAAAVIVLAATTLGQAQTCLLAEKVQPGDCFRYQIDMKLTGAMNVQKLGKVVPLPLEATGSHAFPERVKAVNVGGLPEKSARFYESALAVIKVVGERSERTLRPERRLVVAQRQNDQGLVYCPAGPFRRQELELTSEHFDTLCLSGVLPGKEVQVGGEAWKLPNAVVQALCGFEGLTEQSLTGKLQSVKDNDVLFGIEGKANGIDQGAMVELKIEANGRFDLKSKRLVELEWKQTEERQQGPVSPASSVVSITRVKRQAVETPDVLKDEALVSVPDGMTPKPALLNLEFTDARKRFALLHAREWQVVAQTDERLVLRLVERGDFIAQATITPWTKAEKGKHMSADEFKEKMNSTPGWEPERELQAGEAPSSNEGGFAYRLSMQGKLEDVPVMQNFFLLASANGDQVVVAVTLKPQQADKLGARDLELFGNIEVLPGK